MATGLSWRDGLCAHARANSTPTTFARAANPSAIFDMLYYINKRAIHAPRTLRSRRFVAVRLVSGALSRPAHARRVPLQHEDLIDLMSSFITHAKSNDLNEAALDSRLRKMPQDAFQIRNRIFLRLAKKVQEEWDVELAAAKGIDFEDMLNQAATHLEQGALASPYDLVLADEFQDASWARARLCLALVREPGRFLFAVGDDWQSINRFAGADVSVMTGFEQWCGQGVVLRLQQTFRCPQALCDVSSHFVSKNPAQIPKNVSSETSAHGPVLHAFQVAGKDQIQDAVLGFLKGLSEQVRDRVVPPGRGGKLSVFVLGRYNDDQRRYVPSNWTQACGDVLTVQFMTMHASKGSEADYVILPSMVWGGLARLLPVSLQVVSLRLLTIAIRPPCKRTSLRNATASGKAGAFSSLTQAFQFSCDHFS